jgi:Four helix bundle sensory module for signal transduction
MSARRPSPLAKLLNLLLTNPTWGLVIAIAISLVGNLLTIQYIFTLQNNLETMFNTDLIGQNYVQSARIKLLTINKEINKLFLVSDLDEKYLVTEEILTCRRDVETLLAKSKPFFRARKSAQLLGEATTVFSECGATIDSLVVLSKSDATADAVGIITGQMKTQFERLDGQLGSLDQIKMRHDLRVFRNIDFQLTVSIVFTAVALAITVGVRVFMYRRRKRLAGSRRGDLDGDRVVWE